MLDWCMFRSKKVNRALLNLGGIANLTAIPAGAGLEEVLAFDTGPGNMVIDALMQTEFGKAFDRGGKVAARGRSNGSAVEKLMKRVQYFAQSPPKSCGREQFGPGFAAGLRALCRRCSAEDAVATATFLTGATVLEAFGRFGWPHLAENAPRAKTTEVIVTGGGSKNTTLMNMLAQGFDAFPIGGVKVVRPDIFGVPSQAKEGVAFALLAWLTWDGIAGNVPTATGAKRAVALGKVSYGG
jgi:anhydro-N-acetylmuramic acid kinase